MKESEFVRHEVLRSAQSHSQKTSFSWYPGSAGFDAPSKVQSKEHSMDGGTDGSGYEGASSTCTGTPVIPGGASARGSATTTIGMPTIGSFLPKLTNFSRSCRGSFEQVSLDNLMNRNIMAVYEDISCL